MFFFLRKARFIYIFLVAVLLFQRLQRYFLPNFFYTNALYIMCRCREAQLSVFERGRQIGAEPVQVLLAALFSVNLGSFILIKYSLYNTTQDIFVYVSRIPRFVALLQSILLLYSICDLGTFENDIDNFICFFLICGIPLLYIPINIILIF